MSTADGNLQVQHNETEHRFEATVDGEVCVAEYQRRGDEMVFTHTYVPSSLRGRGIAEKLVRAGLDYARAQHQRVVPACSYVDVYIQRHAEYADLVQ